MDSNNFYRQAIEALTSTLNIEHGLKNCTNFINSVFPCSIISVHLWHEDLSVLEIFATANSQNGQLLNLLLPISEEHKHIPRWANENDIKIVNDVAKDPISLHIQDCLTPIYGAKHYSHMVLRVRIDGRRICDVVLLAEGSNRFSSKDAQLFRSLKSPFGIAVANSLKHLEVKAFNRKVSEENDQLKARLHSISKIKVIGENSGLSHVMSKVDEVAHTSIPILLTGETGVGKDVIANVIQSRSNRYDQPYIRVNCGAIPEELIDSELFGHEKGAFTNAHAQHLGRFERANKGTIFLDEVGELSKAAQVRLLRVLQNGEIERVGGNETINIDVRVIAATNCRLEEMVSEGTFREDLYYRLCVFPITLPTLRQRKMDIPLFTHYFLRHFSQKLQIPTPTILSGEMERLQDYRWPGNVRELSNVVERSMISAKQGVIRFQLPSMVDYQKDTTQTDDAASAEFVTLDEINKKYIEKVLARVHGKIQGPNGAANILGINPHTLRSRMKKLGI